MLEELKGFSSGLPLYCYGWDAIVIAENLMLNHIEHCVEEYPRGPALSLDSQSEQAIPLYGKRARLAKQNLNPSLHLRVHAPGQNFNFEIHNFKPWLLSMCPQAKGLSSGALGSIFSGFEASGQLHDPLFDVKSEFHALCEILKNNKR